ncbi:hypothetical protein [Methylobacterium haplocladii]|uniref:Uncharacterized protein n=2 Tax=Methylobacterium haplocladii TaxID=1176176 RepID=A0A512ITV8_9HYPH|nr:hypothetical protein [Methylobacterium haplocladii]GEP01145.1 hypothetical protein MHA02_35320 [Methylobacterium haplocladii]GJD82895.1 hypothetical protein HPGCJGGD_0757 [Methylobacterium haplocladii]GLS61476.1 hypothetical protein GCM10007887_41890 [Methylobacterium haplocladii]
MPLTVTYDILDQTDGRFGVVATMAPDRIYRRDDLATLAEVEEWIEGLRALMAACGAPVVRAVAEPSKTAPAGLGRTHPRSFSK